jgi:hypothetical protein
MVILRLFKWTTGVEESVRFRPSLLQVCLDLGMGSEIRTTGFTRRRRFCYERRADWRLYLLVPVLPVELCPDVLVGDPRRG